MSEVKQLYALQEIDLEIDADRETLASVEGRIGESEALKQVRASIAEEEERLAKLEREQREGEAEVEDLNSKVADAEGKLYGGGIKNPKELESIQEQTKIFKRKIKELDDKTLDIMTGMDDTERQLASKREEASRMEQEWRAEQESLSRERDEIRDTIATLEDKRGASASKLGSATLELYEALRKKRQGRAVAKVEQGMCKGCRIVLPMSEMQRVKSGQTLVQCGSCERVLYLS